MKTQKTQPSASQPGTKRVYRRAAERRDEIIAAAQDVFARSTFAGARTRDIAEAAGVNQATLFKHFPTKENLFDEAVMKPLIAAMQDMDARVDLYGTASTPEAMAELAVESTARHLADLERILPLLASALFSDVEHGRALFRDHLEPLIRARGTVLAPLVKPGIDAEFVGLASFGMMLAVAMQRWLGDSRDDLREVAIQFNRLSTGGFARTRHETPSEEEDHARTT
ncbi:MAG TPA: TetR/AcrR family transcriptional regulator [Novosphingobium sp.]|nr:TetR/AcrR family transcriptional regulator [Novosphingobium sp.]